VSNGPIVSVVVTCYNYGQYVSECLTSILEQTFRDIEVIVVDDGSTDDSEEKVRPFLDDRRFKYIKQKNGGQANAKNRGIKESRGKYIAFLDADDLWEKDKLEKQLALFRSPAIGVVYSLARLIDEKGEQLDVGSRGKYLEPRSGKVSQWLVLDNFVWFSSSVVKRSCFEDFGLFDESLKMGIDWDLWLRFSINYEFDYINEPLLAYRIGHSGQMSKNLETRQKCSDFILSRFLADYPGVVDKRTIKEAYYYTFCNRGSYFRAYDKKKSYSFFIKAVTKNPFKIDAYKGVLKNIINYETA